MITLSNDDRTVEIDLNTSISKQEVVTKNTVYEVELPKIICTNEDDAHELQGKIQEYVVSITRDLLKMEK